MSVPGNPGDSGWPRGAGAPARPRNGFGIAALVLGILAVLLFWTVIGGFVLSILALIFGILGRARAKRGEATNGGVSVAGIVLGILGLLLTLGVVVFGVFLFNSPAGQIFQQCIQQSPGDSAKIQSCVDQFNRQFGG